MCNAHVIGLPQGYAPRILLEMCQSSISQFFFLSVMSNNPRSLNSMQFPFHFLSDKCPGRSCNSCLEAESPLVCYPNRKTMVNNELPLFKRTNQERPYKQLLHYWSMHLRVFLEQFRFTSLFNQHLGVLVSAPEPHLHPKLPWVLPRTPPQA